ncbi:hypothetical protein FAI41_06895 [Acetobacteraceae bacterium]|nr:hypothetical protein FAI41_06895 [Acetobacteraceae bacterium]
MPKQHHKKAFVIPYPQYKGHVCCYNFDHHVVYLTDENGAFAKKYKKLSDTPEAAGDWALDQNYEVFLQKPALVRNGIEPDPKDSSQWSAYKENDRRLNQRTTFEDIKR